MRTLIIIIVVVVVVDDDTYYWIHLSSDHLFQVYYKVRQLFLLQSAMNTLARPTESTQSRQDKQNMRDSASLFGPFNR